MMDRVLDRVFAVVSLKRGIAIERLSAKSAIDQDLGIRGDDAEELIEAFADEFGNGLFDWPWHDFIDLNEPPAWLGARIWKLLRLGNPAVAFPGFSERRLELGHIAAAIQMGEWFEP